MEQLKEKRESVMKKLSYMTPEEPLSDEMGKLLLNITMMIQSEPKLDELTMDDEIEENGIIKEVKETLMKESSARIIWDRLKRCSPDTKPTLGAMAVLSIFPNSPGEAVITAFYIHMRKNGETVNSSDICTDFFRSGFFSQEQLLKIWELQKRPGETPDNWLDYYEFWDISD